MATTPTPTPRKSASWLWWILGFAGVAMIFLVVGGLLIATYLVKSVRVNPKEQQVEVSTPLGEFKVGSTPAKDVGLPVYPGARLVESGKNVEFSTPDDARVGITAVHYRTSDSIGKVDAWYRAHLGAEFERDPGGEKEGKPRIRGEEVGPDGVAYVSEKGDAVRFIALKKKMGGTEIALGRAGAREPQ